VVSLVSDSFGERLDDEKPAPSQRPSKAPYNMISIDSQSSHVPWFSLGCTHTSHNWGMVSS